MTIISSSFFSFGYLVKYDYHQLSDYSQYIAKTDEKPKKNFQEYIFKMLWLQIQ